MASKYDDYWAERLDALKKLIEEALQTVCSRAMDVSDIRALGKRQNWGTRVTIPPGTREITEELSPDAHGKSLGNVLIHSGALLNVKNTLFARIASSAGLLLLHFEKTGPSHSSTQSSVATPASAAQDKGTQIPEPPTQAFARAIQTLSQIQPQSPFEFGKWQRLSPSDVKKIAILRVCSPQTRVANLRDLEYSPDLNQLLQATTTDSDIKTILTRHGIRFPKNKAKAVKHVLSIDTLGMVRDLMEHSGASLDEERKARLKIKSEMRGMGLKTSSDFLKDIGFSKYLAVLDSRNLRFLQEMGLAPRSLSAGDLQERDTYYRLEDIENELAARMDRTVSELDERIMAYTGDEAPHAI
jgi:thermostable 8-oxoguanine DNA glycosylase